MHHDDSQPERGVAKHRTGIVLDCSSRGVKAEAERIESPVERFLVIVGVVITQSKLEHDADAACVGPRCTAAY